ncbi:MAG: iron dependent repressor, metal binding and dimerization domain protein [Flavobacteriales bacterium]|nr:iron dependent repressor, metal binding and dimerization domain protein [Flavobacteriales bacterium]
MGKRLAVQSKLRHEMFHKFLRSIGIDQTAAVIDSAGVEHHVSPETLKADSGWYRTTKHSGTTEA